MGHPRRILILGAYGTGNLGDELILEALSRLLEGAYPGCAVRAMSYDPSSSETFHGISSVQIPPYVDVKGVLSSLVRARWDWFSKLRDARRAVRSAIEWCDLFVLGGGNLLTDAPFYFLEHFTGQIVRLAHRQRKPIALLGVGLGPINTERGRRLLAELAGWATAAAFREEAGVEAFAAVGFADPRLSGDPVFLFPPSPGPAPVTAPPRALVNVRPLEGHTELPAHVLRAVSLVAQTMAVDGLPMHDELDRPVLTELPGVSSVLQVSGSADIVSAVQSSTVLVGMRLHACIVAATSAVPFLPIAYHPKVTQFANRLAVETMRVDTPIPFSEVESLVTRLFDSPSAQRDALRARVQRTQLEGIREIDSALRALPFDPPRLLES